MRLAMVIEMVVGADASIGASQRLSGARSQQGQARLRRGGGLARRHGAAARTRRARSPAWTCSCARRTRVAQRLRARRHAQGALEFETLQPRAVFEGERVVDIRQQAQNRARQLIEELMIATNQCTAQFLSERGVAVAAPRRRARRSAGSASSSSPRRYGETLPRQPDSPALEAFLASGAPGRSAALSRPVARHRQADGLGRIRRRAAGRSADRPLRPRRARLHALDGAEPALSRPRHAAPDQGGARRRAAPPTAARTGGAGRALHASRKTPRRRSSGAFASRKRR